jgi:hypothetical protein
MAASTALIVPKKSQEALLEYSRQCYNMLNLQWNLREQMRQVDLMYIREQDWTTANSRAKLANRYGDSTKFQNVTVPVVMPQVEAFVTYQASVFLTGQPLFGWVAPPDQESAALQYQAIVEENSIRGGWVRQFLLFFRDLAKYNLGAMEVNWDRVVTAAIETDLNFAAGKQGKPKQVIWEGNCVKRWDLYNTFFDTRVLPTEMSEKGEFVGRTELMSRVALKKFFSELPDQMATNINEAFNSGLGSLGSGSMNGIQSYYVPQINPDSFLASDIRRTTDWMSWAGLLERPAGEINYKNLYEVTTLYARIIPQDFLLNVPGRNTPQVWKFIIVNHSVLVYCERQTNAHNLIPVLFGQSNDDGLGYQTKSLARNAEPFQAISSALVNSAMAARRRAISDRGIYNPSLIASEHINNDSPVAKIPMKPGSYNKTPQEAYYPIPYRDDQSAVAFQELPLMQQMADKANGQNAAKQGQFTKGNRTQAEYDNIMANANGRDQVTSMLLEAQVFTPLKEIIKINTLQYQVSTTVFSPQQQKNVEIDPVELRKAAVGYKISDGLTPTDKLISADAFQGALQVIGSSEQIGGAYNMGPMFSYLMKTQNVDLTQFEKSPQQVSYEQAMSAWQQTCLEIAKAKGEKFPPQPQPAQYGYIPGVTGTNAPQTQSAPASQSAGNAATGTTPTSLGASSVPASAPATNQGGGY